jgi:hypothetical protein
MLGRIASAMAQAVIQPGETTDHAVFRLAGGATWSWLVAPAWKNR